MPSQKRKILPLLEGESKSRMEEILCKYKRTYKPRYRVKFKAEEGSSEGLVLEMIH